MGSNQLQDEGTITVCNTLKGSKVSKLKELLLYNNGISVKGAESVAAYLAVSASLTSLDVGWNSITDDGAQALADVVLDKQSLQSFCNIPLQRLRTDSLTELDLNGKGVGIPGALVLAHFLRVTAVLTKIK